jgi:DNA-binding response OmpR family regulator
MLTAREAVEDRVAGLDAGADDYLTEPFSLAEL